MTIPFRAADAAAWMGGALRQGSPDAQFEGVSIDTRTLRAGLLFVAFRGPRHDAHAYLADALAAGAAGLVIERGRELPEAAKGAAVIEVDDTTRKFAEKLLVKSDLK